MENEQEYAQVNIEVCLGPLDSEAEQLPIKLSLQVLPNLKLTQSLPI